MPQSYAATADPKLPDARSRLSLEAAELPGFDVPEERGPAFLTLGTARK